MPFGPANACSRAARFCRFARNRAHLFDGARLLVADYNEPGGDADAHPQIDIGRRPKLVIQSGYCPHQVERGSHRPLGIVLVGLRVAEVNQNAVAEIARDIAVV
jgi:hypothetical protein